MKPRQQRMLAVGLAVAGVAIAAALTFRAFDENMMFFVEISDVVEGNYPEGRNFRIGGLVVADSIAQYLARGEIHQAIKAGLLTQDQLVELGQMIGGEMSGRTEDRQITVVDSTGVTVQDIGIATAVLARLLRG